ncbi:hypothetical protein AJ80_09789 [Polytolypa hystricis UAMH7299]|uniref:Uncharacterized protein n=1 Tax=Polytolypa hystricis (strain UAMH7299) TaxID=1447883 RepID=A0A2B7WJ57_POLH7|nr:hypothetical protein AJ80_09789 [Polytolypa hystricis UAMH7299]
MSRQIANIPNAWDEDWEAQVDKQGPEPAAQEVPEKKMSTRAMKAQRRAEQAEFNRQLWAEAESPQTFHFLESRATNIPLKSDFRPAVTVLSRKPQIASRQSPSPSSGSGLEAGVRNMSISSAPRGGSGLDDNTTNTISTNNAYDDDDDYDDDDEDEEIDPETGKPLSKLTPEERLAKAQRDREEKQRKYEEVRERLFGSSGVGNGSGASSPGTTTPPGQQSGQKGSYHHHRGARGGGGGARGRGSNHSSRRESRERRDNTHNSSLNPSGAAAGGGGGGGVGAKSRQLFDPGYSTKPHSHYAQRKEGNKRQTTASTTTTTGDEDEGKQQQRQQQQLPVRTPRGPDGSGRGGFGFNQRGAKAG